MLATSARGGAVCARMSSADRVCAVEPRMYQAGGRGTRILRCASHRLSAARVCERFHFTQCECAVGLPSLACDLRCSSGCDWPPAPRANRGQMRANRGQIRSPARCLPRSRWRRAPNEPQLLRDSTGTRLHRSRGRRRDSWTSFRATDPRNLRCCQHVHEAPAPWIAADAHLAPSNKLQ